MSDDLAPATRCVALGRPDPTPGAAVNVPITLSTTYAHGGADVYGRESNPTWAALETALGGLEGGEALVFASGMAAADAALSLVRTGGIVVAPRSAYMGVLGLLADREAAGRVVVRSIDPTDTAAATRALAGADLVWLESPSNPLLDVADLPALLAAARAAGVLSVVDNTFATPLLTRPLELGADIVLHSGTKYLSGHSDVLAGVLVTAANAAGRGLRARLDHHRHLGGAILGPFEAFLVLRGLRTLAVRFERACANAAILAERLATHPAVSRLRFPGYGAMVALEVAAGADEAEAVCGRVRLWSHSTSLGGVESQLERRRRYPSEPEVVPDNLIRLSVGIEDVDDLWRDLSGALGG